MFKDVLKNLRKEKKITQEQLAVILGVERSSIGKYESAPEGKEAIPSVDVLNRIADYFDVSIDYLLGRTDIKKAPATDGQETRTELETQLLDMFARLTPENKQAVAAVIKAMLSDNKE
jgi:transcriptional regulator with XRE-family HTH domain